MKAYGTVEVQLHSFFALVIEVSGVLNAPAEFPPPPRGKSLRLSDGSQIRFGLFGE
jgi:hypothetical protein